MPFGRLRKGTYRVNSTGSMDESDEVFTTVTDTNSVKPVATSSGGENSVKSATSSGQNSGKFTGANSGYKSANSVGLKSKPPLIKSYSVTAPHSRAPLKKSFSAEVPTSADVE